MHGPRLTPEILLRAYAEGLFPMAEKRDDPTLYWVSPDKRGILPLDEFHVPHRLARTVRSGRFTVTSDQAFADVMRACAAPAPGREESWINGEILRLYTALHVGGHAHSIECWHGEELVGGLYGVRLGGAFSAKACFRSNATPARWRWCIWWIRSGVVASPCWIPSSSPRIWRNSARWKYRARNIWDCSIRP